ncbi:MAG: transposase [Chloroflexi bacterium]|nr:transposase [Chloroflexota bacterium]
MLSRGGRDCFGARILIEGWRKQYNQDRTHSALNYRPPAPDTVVLVGLT